MTILVIGSRGQLARALVRCAARRDLALQTLGRPEIDLADPECLYAAIVERGPSVVINAAAFTAVDNAEEQREQAFRINAYGAEAAAKAAAASGAGHIQVSTDYVFAGDKPAPYAEEDEPAPRSAYGASKLLGEQLSLAAHKHARVVRTAWVFDASGANFVRTMLRLARSREQVSVVSDQVGCPTYADDLANALLTIASGKQLGGVFHCAGHGAVSWADFARAIFDGSRRRGGPTADVVSIPSSDYPTRAARPSNSRLDCSKLAAAYSVAMRPWQESLADCLDEISAGGWSVE